MTGVQTCALPIFRVSRRIGAWCTSDGTLVDIYDFIDVLKAVDRIVLTGRYMSSTYRGGSTFIEDFVDQAALV